MADHPRNAQAAPRLHAVRMEIPAVEFGVRENRLPRDLVERDVLGREVRRRRDDERASDPLRIADRPVERLHAAEAPTHDGRPTRNAEPVGELCLRVDPILDGNQRKVAAPRLPGTGIDRHRTARAEATAEVVDADDVETIGVERLAGTDHVVPPADVVRILGVEAGDVMRRVQRVADEDGVAMRSIELAIGFVGELVLRQCAAARQHQRRIELCAARLHGTDGALGQRTGVRGTAGRRGK